MLSSEAVGAAFGRAATTYDEHADLQREAAEVLTGLVPENLPAGPAVDLGAGTAPLADAFRRRWPERRWLALDIAEPMLQEARQRRRLDASFAPVVADIEALPLAPNSLALVYSSFALQWSPDPATVVKELASTLRPGGMLAVTVPVAGSLAELQASWSEVDTGVHVNALADAATWSDALADTDLRIQQWQEQTLHRYYADVRGIARMLRNTGAHRVDRPHGTGLTGRRRFRNLVAAYERRRTEAGLPLTWQVLYVVARKGEAQ
jgi:malonyl-CoA O-methyltransferase